MATRSTVLTDCVVSDWLEELLSKLVASKPVTVSELAVAVAAVALLRSDKP
ncbi:TPA: hypothetical protein TY279_002260 [Streptococcus suis]|uniref:hypothetical protein n=1 Tax=Streptococcus suis TaxID=1307 RepID=UPI0014786EF3|nr:hypothetical protein [Streptococcus suis]MDW8721450.1 hypothetical protein [Streptococcus suis]QZT28581.1 hypothetical protein K6969_07650 [Streptococcus suis]WNF68612.1 hypothetical protein RJW57_07790 [Streptococcus suis]HEL1788641.1 hypothetical protein [Streptococcus suis]HEL1795342.1 hypothetical protein [Streptococcus suis]